jgi:hypothetical protein
VRAAKLEGTTQQRQSTATSSAASAEEENRIIVVLSLSLFISEGLLPLPGGGSMSGFAQNRRRLFQ